jgi:hypothetical protein
MAAAAQQLQAVAHGLIRFGFRKDQPAAGHNGIGRQDECRRVLAKGRNCRCLSFRQSQSVRARALILSGGFVDVGWNDGVGNNARLRKQRLSPRALACKDEREALCRSRAI